MADTLVIAEQQAPASGYQFSWSLAIAGGVAATAITFFLLTLGSGFGLLLMNPQTHTGPSLPVFLTGGAIYFIAAQALGFAVGGYIAGRLLGPIAQNPAREEFRVEAHGFMVWAVAVVATVTMIAIAAMTAGSTTAALYGVSAQKQEPSPSALIVDRLIWPAHGATEGGAQSDADRAAAGRIVDTSLALGTAPTEADRARLSDIIARDAGVQAQEADGRIDSVQKDMKAKIERAANIARKTASYAALWAALSLLLGLLVAVGGAMAAREEDTA